MTNVVALHRPARVSGVSIAGLHAAGMAVDPWRPLIIGSDLTQRDLEQSALAGAPGLALCTWPHEADAVEQVQRVREALRQMDAGVVVPNDLPHGFGAAALDHHRDVRCAAWLHSASHDGEALVTHCFELADAWRAVSAGARARALRTAHEAGLALPPTGEPAPAFVGVSENITPTPRGPLRLLYAGRLEKHHKRVLDLALLCAHLPGPFHLTIAGEGTAEQELRAALAPFSALGRVTFAGAVSPAAMAGLIDQHHVMVLVSGSEAAPTCVMEAMARGRAAAVTCACGEAAAWVRDGIDGLIVPTGDMASLGTRLAGLSDAALRAMGHAAWARAGALFSARARAPALQNLIHEAQHAPGRLASADAVRTHWTRILHALHAIGPVAPLRSGRLGAQWLAELNAAGTSHGCGALPFEVNQREGPGERRLRQTVEGLRTQGASRVALYGGGRHTQAIVRAVEQLPEVIAIIDDRAGAPGGPPASLAGRPVLSPRDYAGLNADALIISSDEHEREMLAKAHSFAPRVITLYDAA